MIRAVLALATLFAGIWPAAIHGQTPTIEDWRSIITAESATGACLINFGSQADRDSVNGLVMQVAGVWKAIIHKSGIGPDNPVSPCNSRMGICAAVIGQPIDFEGICDPSNPVMEAYLDMPYLRPAHGTDLLVLPGAEALMELARGLQDRDRQAEQLKSALVWYGEAGPDRTSARLRTGTGEISVAWLRSSLDDKLATSLADLVRATNQRHFDLAGTNGALAGTSLYRFSDLSCTTISNADDFWDRIARSNAIVPVERPETDPVKKHKIYEDAIQNLLDGAGPTPPDRSSTFQDPVLYLTTGAPCP